MSESLIRRIPLFTNLPSAEIEAMAGALNEVGVSAKTVLFREGEHGDQFFIVMSGEIAIIKAMDTEEERLLGVRGPGEFIGEMSLLNRQGLRMASARTQTDVRLLVMTRADFDALLHRKPTIAYEMLRVLSERLNTAHHEIIEDLQEKNRQLRAAYKELQAAQEQIVEKEILERELIQAREIQESMLPSILPRLEGYEVGVRMVPARMVGGDFYDVFQVDRHRLGLVVADVSGKGMPAALFMALTRSLLRAEAGRSADPGVVLKRVNEHLLEMNAKGMFVTILFAILDRDSGQLNYVRAGHEIPLMWNRAGEALTPDFGRGQVLGLFPSPILEVQCLTLPPGGTLLLYTDGVTEAINARGEFLGLSSFQASVPQLLNSTAQELCDHLIDMLVQFHGEAPQADDITLVSVKVLS